jgi:hypothetical protein
MTPADPAAVRQRFTALVTRALERDAHAEREHLERLRPAHHARSVNRGAVARWGRPSVEASS